MMVVKQTATAQPYKCKAEKLTIFLICLTTTEDLSRFPIFKRIMFTSK